MPTDGFIRPGNILDLEGNEIVDVGAPLSGTSADRVQDRNTAITAAVTALVNGAAAGYDTFGEIQAILQTHVADTGNPHGVTKAQVGLGAVTNDAQLPLAGGTLTGRTVTAPVTLTYSGSTFTPAAGAGNLYRGTLTQATTVANPSGTPADGQVIRVALTQDGTGGWAVTWGSKYLGSDDVALGQPASGASKRSVFTFEYDAAADRWLLLGKNAGYQL